MLKKVRRIYNVGEPGDFLSVHGLGLCGTLIATLLSVACRNNHYFLL